MTSKTTTIGNTVAATTMATRRIARTTTITATTIQSFPKDSYSIKFA
jgi:hypothetical protein